jgi:hypothetical protein
MERAPERTNIAMRGGRSRFAARLAARLRQLRAEAASAIEAGSPADTNRVQLSGLLGSEPLLYDIGDHSVAELALACQCRYQVSCGALQLTTTWFNLTACEELAAYCGRFLHRGDQVSVAGTLQLWTETRGPVSVLCHRVLLDDIVLLAVGQAR